MLDDVVASGPGTLTVGVLGPLLVRVDGKPVVISSARERAVIEALALRPGAPTRVETLVDAIWGEDPPPNARKVVQTYVARLRKVLPPGAIVSAPDGYRLDVSGRDAVDAQWFEDLVGGAPRHSAARIRDGLDLWRGEPYESLADVASVIGVRARLVELRRTAEEDELDALLARGEHARVVAQAEVAVAAEPLRERRWGQLMIALFRCGRQADALRAFQRCRDTLVDTLGIDPGPDLQEIERAVLAHDARLQPPAPTAAGRGQSLPLVLDEVARRPIVGRVSEIAELQARWTSVRDGDRATVVLVGEAGAGKTRISAAFGEAVIDDGGQVLYGRCSPELAMPYQPFAEALGVAIGERSAKRDEGSEPLAVFHDVVGRLAAMAASAPLLVVVEDLHWATPPTRRLLRHLAAAPELKRVLLLATSRAANDADLGELATASRMTLGALGVEDIAALVALQSPEDVEESATLHDLAGGNPFLVEQLLLDRAAARRGGSAHASRANDVVALRVQRLSDQARAVLELSALVGLDFAVDTVARASVGDVDAVLSALEEAETNALIVPVGLGRFTFCHALVRSVLLSSMPATRRMRHHRDLAVALESGPAAFRDPAALARHYTGCAPLGHAREAVTHNRTAGDIARRRAASEEAASFYGEALDALELLDVVDESARCELLIAKGEVLRRIGDESGQNLIDEAIDWARSHRDGRRFATVVFAMNRFGLTTDVTGATEMVRLVEEAIDLLGDEEPAVRARLLAVLAAELTYLLDTERRVEASANALALARQLDDDEVLARVLVGCVTGWAAPEDLDGRFEKASELLALAERLDADELLIRGHREVALAALEAGHLETYRAGFAVVRDLTTRLRDLTFQWELGYMEAADLHLVGDLDGAERTARRAAEVGRRAGINPGSVAIVLTSLLGVVHLDQGRLAEDIADVRALADLVPTSPFSYFLPMLELEAGDRDAAAATLAALATNDFEEIPRRQTWPLSLAMVGEAAAELGNITVSTLVHDKLAPLSGRFVAGESFRYTPVDRILGRLCLTLGRIDDAARHLRAADALVTGLQAPTIHARVVVDRARLAIARGDGDDAERLIDAANVEASAHGAHGIVAAARRLRT